ncbi:MAG TPA: PASTA domain-containing protein [Thermohalobaculum sp.]|nr:PASTA domain-containing protein [Thermohalobaculum sp.]
MVAVVVAAKIFTDEGKPAVGHNVEVHCFSVNARSWRTVLNARTNNAGVVSARIPEVATSGEFAPAFRLVEPGSPVPRVLATGGMVQFNANSKILMVDFGEIERLEETSFQRQHVASAFRNTKHVTAGVPKRPEVNTVGVTRMVLSNPALVAGFATPGAAAATPDATVALLVSKETAAFKKRETELNSLLMDKDRQIMAKTDNLTVAENQIKNLEASLATARVAAEAARGEAQAAKAAEAAAKAQAEAARVAAQASPKPATTEADVGTLLSNFGSKLNVANTQMKTRSVGYKVSNVKLDLRGKLLNEGQTIQIGRAPGDAPDDSGLSAELIPDDPATRPDSVAVPDVSGLTEAAVRRVLASVGLRLNLATKTLADGQGTAGQSIQQHPAAGSDARRGSSILVVFGVRATPPAGKE